MTAERRRALRRAARMGAAAMLATFVAQITHLPNPWFATLAAIVAVGSTVQTTFRSARDAIVGSAIGAVLGLGVATVAKDQAWAVGLTVALTLAVAGWFRAETLGRQAALVASVVVLVPASSDLSTFDFAVIRFTQAAIGILAAIFVQTVVFPPRAHRNVRHELAAVYRDMALLLESVAASLSDGTADREELRSLRHDVRRRMASVDRLWAEALSEHPNRGHLAPHWRVTTRRIWEQCSVLATETIGAGQRSPLSPALCVDVLDLVATMSEAMRSTADRFDHDGRPGAEPGIAVARIRMIETARDLDDDGPQADFEVTLRELAIVNALNVIAERLVDLAFQDAEASRITGPFV